ncbi:MAG TPA: ABC transporter permease [Bacteroidia bacterium]|nr:ABC transporter permease [Bacteroidia bacterium]
MSKHKIVIEPGTENSNYWKDLWNYRGLFYFLAWRDILVRYKQTAIGILWSVLRPALTIFVMWFIGWLFGSSVPDGVPRILLVCAATLPWQFFSSSFSETSNSLIANSNLLTKVYFPRLIVPASTVIVCLIDFFVSFVILIVIMIFTHYVPDIKILLLPLFLLLALVISIGMGLYIAALNVKYRDFRYVIPFVVQFGLYISPVAFSSDYVYNNAKLPQIVKYIYSLNPMVGVIDGFRWCILGGKTGLYLPGFFISVAISILFLFIGIWYFRKMEKSFADII